MEFELEYKLNEFREMQDQYFDKNNKCYTGINLSANIMEIMLKLIDELSKRVNEIEPVIKQQIKKSLPIQGVSNSVICDYCKGMGRKYCGVPLGHIKCPKCGKY